MKASIVIPVYNTAPYLDACLASVLGQGVDDMEVICVDDGSTDGSPGVLAAWARRDPRLRVISQANTGQGAARNRGVDSARGKYLLFVDSDDVLRSGALAMLLREVGDAQVISFEHTTFVSEPTIAPVPDVAARQVPREKLLRQMGVVWNKMVRLDWWIASGLRFRERVIFEDIPLHWRLVLAPDRIRYLPASLYALRVRPDSTTGANAASPRRLDSIRAHDEVARLFAENPAWAPYDPVRREIMLRNLAACIDALDGAPPATLGELRRLAGPHLSGVDLSREAVPGLSLRERDALRAFQGYLPSAVRRRLLLVMRSVVRLCRRISSR